MEQATADVAAQGVEPATAEQVAMARMGAPESPALSLAVAHHRHIAWRHDYGGRVDWLFISVTFSVAALAAGWLTQALQRTGWFIRT